MVCKSSCVLWVCVFLLVLTVSRSSVTYKSPYYQFLPDCSKFNESSRVLKKTSLKGIVCPIVKDEEGFLSEWVAYYEMHGFNHVILYDNNSTSSFAEVQPWIDSGFVTIRRNWWIDNPRIGIRILNPDFYTSIKTLDYLNEIAGIDCKLTAIEMGIDLFLPVDPDEYAVPQNSGLSLMDDLEVWLKATKKQLIPMRKLNFSPSPHFHEPIHLLTIEAYQTRFATPSRMNYYVTTSGKSGLRLLHPTYSKNTTDLLLYCCSFHGCALEPPHYFEINGMNCSNYKSEYFKHLWNKKDGIWLSPPYLNHYARSLEKFTLKQQSWIDLSTQRNDSAGNPQGLSIYNFMNRAYGTTFDDRAVKWGCQLRELLFQRTKQRNYLRPGDMWYRNVEYGCTVNDPHKRGRHGKGENLKVRKNELNEYPPEGTYQAAHSDNKCERRL